MESMFSHNSSISPYVQNETFPANQTNETTVLPTDQTSPIIECDKPWNYIPTNVLLTLWKFIYWTSQLLTWILLPLLQSYCMSGEFTRIRKFKSSLIDNLKYYCFFGVLFLLFLIYYASRERPTFEGLKIFCISSSNTFGLFLLVVLMGYGLVEIPRTCFNNYYYDFQRRLQAMYFKIAKLRDEKCEADAQLDDYLDEIRHLYLYALSTNSVYIGHLRKIISNCPDAFRREFLEINNVEPASHNPLSELNESNLIKLNAKIKRVIQTVHRTEVQFQFLVEEAIRLKYRKETGAKNYEPSGAIETWLDETVPGNWQLIYRLKSLLTNKRVFFLLGCILATLSVVIIWSEFTFFIKSYPISIFALIVKQLHFNYSWIQASFSPLVYENLNPSFFADFLHGFNSVPVCMLLLYYIQDSYIQLLLPG